MPMKLKDYPPNWRELSWDLRQNRAKQRCEHPHCDAPNNTLIQRYRDQPEEWALAFGKTVEANPGKYMKPIRVVLTCAHTCECRPICGNPEHIKVLCQLHHLRLDAKQHATNARETKRARKLGGMLPGMEKP